MHNIEQFGYLAAYSGNPQYGFKRQFDKKVCVSFDSIVTNPNADFKICVSCEPPVLYHQFQDVVEEHAHEFDLILTYNPRLLALPNARNFCPVGTWVSPDLKLDKLNQISFMMSGKLFTFHQRMRFIIMRRYSHLKTLGQFDFLMHRSPPRAPSKDPYFTQAKFNIACENHIMDNMFTEKLLDCFYTRTVPIYYGCSNIGNYFDARGILQFSNIDELDTIIKNLDPSDYDRMQPYIEENYQRAKYYADYSVYQRIEHIVEEILQQNITI
jgi:hypothetical protein